MSSRSSRGAVLVGRVGLQGPARPAALREPGPPRGVPRTSMSSAIKYAPGHAGSLAKTAVTQVGLGSPPIAHHPAAHNPCHRSPCDEWDGSQPARRRSLSGNS